MNRQGIAVLLSLVLTAAGCGLLRSTEPATTSASGPTTPAVTTEEPPPDNRVTGYIDQDAVIQFDGDGDGAVEHMYQLAQYDTPAGITVEEWVDVETSGQGVDGRLWFVLENRTDGSISEAAVEFEIPKSLVAEISAESFTIVEAESDAVEITIIDPDPRFEVRVVDFAGGLRPSIRTEIDPELIALGAGALFGTVSQADIEAYAVGRTVETATHVINMTSRDFSFLRKARKCEAIPDDDRLDRQLCAAMLVVEFPDKFTEQDCAEIAAFQSTYPFSVSGCRAAVTNDPAVCADSPSPGNCLGWVELAATNRCAILAGYPGARDRCAEGVGPWLAGYCQASDWSETCCETLVELGHPCDGADVDAAPPTHDLGVYPVDEWFTSSFSACEAIGAALPDRVMEDHSTFGGETDIYLTDYADSLFSQGVECLFRDPDAWYQSTQATVSCWPTEADADFVWNGDYGGGSINENRCGADPGVPADWTVDCAGTDHVTIDEGSRTTGGEQYRSGSLHYRHHNCSVLIQHSTGPSIDPVQAVLGFEPTINAYLDSLR